MPRSYRPTVAIPALLSLLFAAGSASAQLGELPRVGLSAAPDAYVAEAEGEIGVPFTLHVIATGPEGIQPLPFGLGTVQWAVFAVCCGGAAGFVAFDPDPALAHEGHPLVSVTSSVPECLEQDVVHLGTVTFVLADVEPGQYVMVAGATGFTLDCDGGEHLLMDLSVTVDLTGEITDLDVTTWGGVKSLYR